MARISVVGAGPGGREYLTLKALSAIGEADLILGYGPYLRRIEDLIKDATETIYGAMGEEALRARVAVEEAAKGRRVVIMSGGDPGIYGMSSFLMEFIEQIEEGGIEVEIVPGVSSVNASAAVLGSPLLDHAVISLSDMKNPLALIEEEVRAAASSDLVLVLLNPKSSIRKEPLDRTIKIVKEHRGPETPVGIVREAKREGEWIKITTLGEIEEQKEEIDMSTTVVVGNGRTRTVGGYIWTPRVGDDKVAKKMTWRGRDIESMSLAMIGRTLEGVEGLERDLVKRVIHATGDPSFREILEFRDPERGVSAIRDGADVITDVKMVEAGINRECLRSFGGETRNYLRRVTALASDNETRSMAAIRCAFEEGVEGSIIAIGNSPTAVMAVIDEMKMGNGKPAFIIAVPPGFVDANRSKTMVREMGQPSITTRGTKGGSPVAVALVNQLIINAMGGA
jgi:precorrin-3B C17-methyltransferase